MPGGSVARLIVPDVLRGAAIVAMLIAHAAPFLPQSPRIVGFLTGNISDLASPLFILVMGMSAQLVWNRSDRVGVVILQQCVRGVVLIALGVWMASWGSWVAVVLAYLGVTLIMGAPLLLCRSWLVAVLAVLLLAVSQPLLVLARTWAWVWEQPEPVREVMTWLFYGPQYRVVNLLPLFLLGGLLVRHGLRRDRLLLAMGIVAPLAYGSWVVADKILPEGSIHSGDYVDSLRDIGLVFAVYVVVVLAATVTREGAKRFWHAVFVPLIACGQVALSLYLLHVGLIALWAQNFGRPTENFWPGWLVIVPGMILVGWLWWRFVGTGPVEWLMGWVTGRRKPLLRAR